MSFKYILCFCLFSFFALKAQSVVKSPDGKLKVLVSKIMECRFIVFLIMEKIFLENSPLGLKTNVGDFTTGLVLES